MIYRTNFFREELSYGYYERKKSLAALILLGAFLGMLTFSIYFVFQTLRQSVLSDAASFLMEKSNHTTALMYTAVSFLAFWIYLSARFQMLTYSEVYENTWYGLVHSGYSIVTLVLGKLLAQLFGILLMYTAGFLTTLLMSAILRFPLIVGYLISLYLAGALNCASLLILAMAASLVVRDISNARSLFSMGALLLIVLQIVLGFFSLVTRRESIIRVSALFVKSAYLYVDLAIMIACVAVSIVKGGKAARIYHEPMLSETPRMESVHGAQLVVRTESSENAIRRNAKLLSESYMPKKRGNLLSSFMSFVLFVVVFSMLAVDLMLLAFSYASPEKETSVLGYMPYVFQSSTMEPQIKFNDVAMFELVDQYVAVNEEDVVMYKDETGIVQVRRVLKKFTDETTNLPMIEVDIDYYPQGSQQGILHAFVEQSAVFARLVGVNRWLGVVILFANSTLGRLMLMLVPIILLFFSKQINEFFRRIGDPARKGARTYVSADKLE